MKVAIALTSTRHLKLELLKAYPKTTHSLLGDHHHL
jgi:hypothetical protein